MVFPIFLGILLLASAGLISSAAVPNPSEASDGLVSYVNDNDGLGNYRFRFETVDHLIREETGKLLNSGQPDAYIVVHGTYSYIRPDGQVETVRYIADKDGYRILPVQDRPPEDLGIGDRFNLPAPVIATFLGK